MASLARFGDHSFGIWRGQANGCFCERDASVLQIVKLDDR
jgi:hypothetical protein